jgi:hypothetical protein
VKGFTYYLVLYRIRLNQLSFGGFRTKERDIKGENGNIQLFKINFQVFSTGILTGTAVLSQDVAVTSKSFFHPQKAVGDVLILEPRIATVTAPFRCLCAGADSTPIESLYQCSFWHVARLQLECSSGWLVSRTSVADVKSLRTTEKILSLCRECFVFRICSESYAPRQFIFGSPSNTKIIQRLQSNVLRTITNAPWFVSTSRYIL